MAAAISTQRFGVVGAERIRAPDREHRCELRGDEDRECEGREQQFHS
jgi:hypothetical protein